MGLAVACIVHFSAVATGFVGDSTYRSQQTRSVLQQPLASESNRPLCRPNRFVQGGQDLTKLFVPPGKDHLSQITWPSVNLSAPLSPLTAHYKPPFWLCWRTLYADGTVQFVSAARQVQAPGTEHDCDLLVGLMDLALDPWLAHGVGIDVGASNGNCGFLWLNAGHEVHFFEKGLDVQGVLREELVINLEVNNWTDKANLHGEVGAAGEPGCRSLDAALKDVGHVHVLKIDVDHIYEYRRILLGAADVLTRTDIVQVEMMAFEIGRTGINKVAGHLMRAGFAPYAIVEDLHHDQARQLTLKRGLGHGIAPNSPGNGCLEWIVNKCADRAVRQMWPQAPEPHGFGWCEEGRCTNQSTYKYGADGVEKIRLQPICDLKPVSFCCFLQFAFIRQASLVMAKVQSQFGFCATLPVPRVEL